MPIQFVKDSADFNLYLLQNKYVVANFTAAWCGPCQALKPIVDKLYEDAKYSKVEIIRVDLDTNGDIASEYSITSVPTFVFFESGKEVERQTGFLVQFKSTLDKYAVKANSDTTITGRGASAPSEFSKEISPLLPKGYYVLNDVIHFGEMVALNSLPLVKSDEADVKNVFKTSVKGDTTVLTDADSQALFFIPLNNICKLYSVLIKLSTPKAGDNLELDEDELTDETQVPSVVKLWTNRPGILAFEDAAGDSDASHVEKITDAGDGWYEVKVKYVRFQNVQNLNIFIDGSDEDFHTLVEKIVLVGVCGDSKEQGAINAGDDE
ncbi:CIC11C00000005577 [Sungouiella intermedia]|uniref:CIC11C00000005577 n=1 Tax=Sungouiella intermedia TaxID=45354 RepID=A0A1L0CZ28_9ASCO|nr:CIC11C00000005577 [[Candida] intermedia]